MDEEESKFPDMEDLRKEFVPRELCKVVSSGVAQLDTDIKELSREVADLKLETLRELGELKSELTNATSQMTTHEKGHNNVWTRRHTGAVMLSTIFSGIAILAVLGIGILTIIYN